MIKWSARNNITKNSFSFFPRIFLKSNFPVWWVERDANRESRFHYLLLLLFFVRISQLSPFSFVVSFTCSFCFGYFIFFFNFWLFSFWFFLFFLSVLFLFCFCFVFGIFPSLRARSFPLLQQLYNINGCVTWLTSLNHPSNIHHITVSRETTAESINDCFQPTSPRFDSISRAIQLPIYLISLIQMG